MFVLCLLFVFKVFGGGGAHSSTAFRGMVVFFFFSSKAYHILTAFCAPIFDRNRCHQQRYTHLCPLYGILCAYVPIWWPIYTTHVCICTEFLRCPAVGHVLAWWLCCCKMRPGSACGGWLFAVTVYWIMVTVARWFVIWWLTG